MDIVDYTLGDMIDILPAVPTIPDKKPPTLTDNQITDIIQAILSRIPSSLQTRKILDLINEYLPSETPITLSEDNIFIAHQLAFILVNGSTYRQANCMLLKLFYLATVSPIYTVGLLFLSPPKFLTIDVSDWDYDLFLSRIDEMTVQVPNISTLTVEKAIPFLGTHVRKQKSFYQTVAMGLEYPSIQFFAGLIKPEDFNAVAELVEEENIPAFIHTPYSVNLSQRGSISKMKKELELCVKCQFQGVVVHTGKGSEDVIDRMTKNIVYLCDHVQANIILETPAGQTGETLTSILEFTNLIQSINKPNLKICVDTCHVYAAGYDPLYYILYVEKHLPDKLIVVHLNNSKSTKCNRRDLHAWLTEGTIPISTMLNVISYCQERNIPMIVE